MPDWIVQILNDLPQITATAALAVGLAFGLFKFLGKKIIDNRFEKEIEQFRAKLNSASHRANLIRTKRLETLPIVWALTSKAFNEAIYFVSAGRVLPDFTNSSDLEIREVLVNTNFSESQINKIILASPANRSSIYHKLNEAHLFLEVKQSVRLATECLRNNSIFLDDTLYQKIDELLELCFRGSIQADFIRQYPNVKKDTRDKLLNEGKKMLDDVSNKIRDYLLIV